MAYDSYKIYRTVSSSNPKTQMLNDKAEQVKYLYDIAVDREDGCLLNGVTFMQSPRIFDRRTKSEYMDTITVETIELSDRFYIGDYLRFEGETWLCTNSLIFHGLYCRGNFTRCNHTLKFQSPTGTILSYPCITSTKSFNEDNTKVITLPSNQKSILCVSDENTSLIKTGDRFYVDRLNNTTWHVVGAVDNTTYNYGDKGLIYFFVEQDVEQVSNEYPDRPDLGICNYFEPTVDPEPPVEGYSYAVITCSNPNNEIILGASTYRTLTPTFYNADNTVATGITGLWYWELPSGFENAFNISYDGNLAKIKVAENYDLLGLTIKANVQNSGGFYRGSIILTIVI